jgi:hypothetical protein
MFPVMHWPTLVRLRHDGWTMPVPAEFEDFKDDQLFLHSCEFFNANTCRTYHVRPVLEDGPWLRQHCAALVDAHRAAIERRHDELAEVRRRQSDAVRTIAARLDDARRRRGVAERELEECRPICMMVGAQRAPKASYFMRAAPVCP